MKLNELLTPELFEQVQARIDEVNAGQTDKMKQVRFADLSEGGYVSVGRYNGQVNALNQQLSGLQAQIAQRDTDITGLQEQLTAAQGDAVKLAEVQSQLLALQQSYTNAQQEWEANNARQRREFMVRERANDLQFTSAAAKRDFLSQANGKEFQVDGETLMGYEDFVTKYRDENPGAFVTEQPPAPPEPAKPTIVLPGNSGVQPHGKSLSEMMKAKNANPDMIVSFKR